MFIISSYPLAVIFCVITMFCWGSWANTQKLAGKSWRFELFYWDYVLGILIFSLLIAFTLGSTGEKGRSFLDDLSQADGTNIRSALVGGIVFNGANILIAASIALAGMAVAFPVGIGLALILGVIINYFGSEKGNAFLLFTGVCLVAIAIVLNAVAYGRKNREKHQVSRKGLLLALAGGFAMSFFYRFVASSMDLDNFENPAAGKMTPYSAVFVFSLGILFSNFLFNTILMKKPVAGSPTGYGDYFRGKAGNHLTGIAGGLIWGMGNSFNLLAAGRAGPAISYGLGQGATLVAAMWGVFVWKEFRDSPACTGRMIAAMFLFFLAGLAMIVYAGT